MNIVHMPAEKNMARLIDTCRKGAVKDRSTVIIERHTQRKDGSVRKTPLLEITPHGDLREVDAPVLRVSLASQLGHAMRQGSAEATAVLDMAAAASELIAEARARRKARWKNRENKAKHHRRAA